jgi:UDP-3-O-[3-hydroxymyristoyl] glucosamine N-acyltransferase
VTTQERTLAEIAEHVGGTIHGDPTVAIRAAATLENARVGDITFVANRKYERQLQTTEASAVIVGEKTTAKAPLLVVDDPYYVFSRVMVLLHGYRKHKNVGISPRAAVSESAKVGEGCHVHDFVTIADNARIGDGSIVYPGAYIGEGVRIGSNSIIFANVAIYEDCRIGNRVIINANSTIGVDGFGYATHEGVHHKIPQVGRVVIEDDVEIGSCCGIERGTLDDTVIGRGSKLGDLVTIGHGTKLGPYCLLVAQVGIAGSTTLGHHCVIGGQVGIVGHITIGDHVTVGAQAGVVNSIPDGETVLGAPAIDANQARRAYTLLQYLPQMRQDIRNLQHRLRKIVASIKTSSDGKTDE